jgi:hypothetical protein
MGLLIATTLAIGSGCAKEDWIDRTLVTVDVTGTWSGGTGGVGGGSRDVLMDLEQQGSRVKGSMRFPGGSIASGNVEVKPGPIEGTVTGDVFRFRQTNGNVEGEVKVSGEEMIGRASLGIGSSRPLSLRRVNPSSSPGSPPR